MAKKAIPWTPVMEAGAKDGQQYTFGPSLMEGGEGEIRGPCPKCGQQCGPVPFEIPAWNTMGDTASESEREGDGTDLECPKCGTIWGAWAQNSYGGVFIQIDNGPAPHLVEVRITHNNMADESDDG